MLTRIKIFPVSNYKQDDIYRNKNSSAFLQIKIQDIIILFHDFSWLSMTLAVFHDFPGLKNGLINSMTFQEERSLCNNELHNPWQCLLDFQCSFANRPTWISLEMCAHKGQFWNGHMNDSTHSRTPAHIEGSVALLHNTCVGTAPASCILSIAVLAVLVSLSGTERVLLEAILLYWRLETCMQWPRSILLLWRINLQRNNQTARRVACSPWC